jgi:hypothetical protein
MNSQSNNFNDILTEYQNTYKEYVDYLNTNSSDLKSLLNSSYNSSSVLNNQTVTSANDCKTNCMSNSLCSGATYNLDSNMCTLYSGIGNIINSTNSTSLVPGSVYYNYKLQELNEKLIQLNQKMLTIAESAMSQYNENSQKTLNKKQQLQTNYQTLLQERDHIGKILKEFQTVNSAYNNGSIILTSNYYKYILWILIIILLIFLLIKFTVINPQKGGSNINYLKILGISRLVNSIQRIKI